MRKNLTSLIIVISVVVCSFFGMCSEPLAASSTERLSVEEQQQLAYNTFMELYKYADPKIRPANIEKMIDLYKLIIEQCPDVSLAEESSLRLIEVYFLDYKPAKINEAMKMYNKFQKNYPDSILRQTVRTSVERNLYIQEAWDELVKIETDAEAFLHSSVQPESPKSLFLFSEANYHLKDMKKAGRGYEIIVKYFPDSRLANKAKNRIRQIADVSKNIN